MNNYNKSIFCDEKTELTSELNFKDILTDIPNISLPLQNLSYDFCNVLYLNNFAYYKNDTIIGRSLKHYGEYTELEIQLLRNFIKSDTIIYDIGANIGYHTVAFAKLAKHVYAFEPNKKNLHLLHLNTKSLKNVNIYDMACSDKNDTMYIEDFDVNKPGNYGEMHMLDGNGQECKTVKIDDIDDIYVPDIIKIDVEGHELQVLLGSIDTITEYKPIIFYEAHGNDLDKIYELLTNLDYKLYWFPCSNYNNNNFNKNTNNIFGNGGVLNILAVHNMPKIGNLLPVKKEESFAEAVTEYMANNAVQK